MSRSCIKCGEQLVVDEKLQIMVCVTNNHLEPINLNATLWWNQCPKCKQIGTNTADGEASRQVIEIKYIEGKNVKVPVTEKVGDKEHTLVFAPTIQQKDVTCRACGHSWLKK